MQRGTITEHFPIPGQDQLLFPDIDQVAVHGHAAALEVLRNPEVFSSSWYDPSLGPTVGHALIAMDDPEHRRLRLLLQPAFSKPQVARWTDRVILPIVDEQLDAVASLGRADLYEAVGSQVPIRTIAAVLGLPGQDHDLFFEWAVTMTSPVETPERRLAAFTAVDDYVRPLVAARRAETADDMLGLLVSGTVTDDDGSAVRPLDDDEIATFVRLLIIAGASTTYRAYGLAIFALLTHPEQLAEVRADRSLIPQAIEETLRWEQPLVHFGRMATTDTELGGVPVAAGCPVNLNIGAGNHDPAAWPDPDRFDIHRERPDRHLTFGFGVHRCLGIHLARAELQVMIGRTLDRLPNLRLDPDAEAPYVTGLGFRMVTGLPVVWGS